MFFPGEKLPAFSRNKIIRTQEAHRLGFAKGHHAASCAKINRAVAIAAVEEFTQSRFATNTLTISFHFAFSCYSIGIFWLRTVDFDSRIPVDYLRR